MQGFPDFILVNQDNGARIGYDVKYIRGNVSFIKHLIRERTYRGYYEVNKGNLTELKIVAVLDDENKLEQAKAFLQSPKTTLPEGVSFILGVIVENSEGDNKLPLSFVPKFIM